MMQETTLRMVVEVVDKATSSLRDINRSVDGATSKLQSFGSIAIRALGAIGVGLSASAIIRNMSETETSTRKLTTAVSNLGAQSGVTVPQVQALAEVLQRTTRYSDEAVQDATVTLLRFGAVTRDTLKPTLAVVADLASGLQIDLTNAASMVARALADPERGLRQLRQAGVVFTADQTKVIRGLVETGDKSKAASIVMGELARIYKGSASDAVNTFSGAMDRLKNVAGNLLEGPDGGLKGVTSAINDLTDTLADPQVKENFDAFFGEMVRWLGAVLNLLSKTIEGWKNLIGWAAIGLDRTGIGKSAYEKNLELLGAQDRQRDEYIAAGRKVPEGLQRAYEANLAWHRAHQGDAPKLPATPTIAKAGKMEPFDPFAGLGGADDVAKAAAARKREFEMADLAAVQREAGDVPMLLALDQLYPGWDEPLKEIPKLVDDIGTGITDMTEVADKEWAALMDSMQESLTEVRGPYDDFIEALKAGLQNAAIQGKVSARSLISFIIAELTRKELFAAIDAIGDALGGVFNGKSSSGGGGLLKGIGSFIGSLFGGKAGGGRASGFTLVGEEGPEVAYFGSGGRVMNSRQMAFAGAGARAQQVVNETHNHTYYLSGVETQQVVAYIEQTRRQDQMANVKMLERNGFGRMR